MNHSSIAIVHECGRKVPILIRVALAVLLGPIQIFICKILIQRLQLGLPRYKILLSLTISDGLQITFTALTQLLGIIFQLEATSFSCQVSRKILEFISIATVITASGSIVALSIERYVACVHCFRLHEIITDKVINRFLCCLWTVGVIVGFLDNKRYERNTTLVALPLTEANNIIYVITVLSSSVIITYVQIRLYLTSKEKNKVQPGANFGRAAEASDLRKRQMKISMVASAVVVLYVVCMCPLAFYMVFNRFKQPEDISSGLRLFCFFLTSANTVVDPLLYGFGMTDTRKAIKKEFKQLKNYIWETVSQHNL